MAREALVRYGDDGRLEIGKNAAVVTLGHQNYSFPGSDVGRRAYFAFH